MVKYPLGDQRLTSVRSLAILRVKGTGDWRTVRTYKLPIIAHEFSPQGPLGRFVAKYEAENNSLDLREHLTGSRAESRDVAGIKRVPLATM
jgi:hypothetical protein